MFKYYVYIETETFVLPLVIYADSKKDAYRKGVKQFNKVFKKKIVKVTVYRDHYWFGGFEY